MNSAIETFNLTKYFGDVCAVKNISINVRQGEIYGFLGLNGAGKTTTIRMLLGLVNPSSGTCSIFDEKVNGRKKELWNRIGYMVEMPYSYPDLTVSENLEIIRRMRFIPDKKAVNNIIDKLNLGEYSGRKTRNLSLGNNQRLGLAKALIHEPSLLILDEPSNGLDPAGIVEIRDLLTDLSGNGATIFVSSHNLGEISKIATRLGIIHEGRLISELGADALNVLCRKRLIIMTRDNNKAESLIINSGYSLKKLNDRLETDDENAVNSPDQIAEILVNGGSPPIMLKVEEENLESFFLRTIGMKGDTK